MLNKIIIIGNLTKDPETGSTKSSTRYTRFNVAVNRKFENADGEKLVDYFNVIAWSALADTCAKYLFKGDKVGIVGSMQQTQYTKNDGTKTISWNLVANEVEFLNSKPAKHSANQSQDTEIGEQSNTQQRTTSARTKKNRLYDDDCGIEPVDSDELPF